MHEQIPPQSRVLAAMGQVDITPPVGIYHRMWGAALHDQSEGVHRPLMAILMILRPRNGDPNRSMVTIGMDHCIMDALDLKRIQEAIAPIVGVDPERVLVCMTHTHAAGLMSRTRASCPGGEMIGPYLDDLTSKLAQLAEQVVRKIKPAIIQYGKGRCDLAAERDYWDSEKKQYICGYNPLGIADDTLLVSRIVDEEGSCIGTIVNYACHPTTLAWDNRLISPDYPGAMREVVEAATGAPCLFLQGASGDLGPREGFVGDVEVADRHGRRLGYAVLSVIEGLGKPDSVYRYQGAVVSGTLIGTWRDQGMGELAEKRSEEWKIKIEEIQLPYRHDLPTLEETRQELSRWKGLEELADSANDRRQAAVCRAMAEQMQRQIWRQEELPEGPCYPMRAYLFRIGCCWWLFVPGEHYQFFQIELRRRFDEVPWIISTIANGWQPGYVPPAHKYGYGIYQEKIALVSAGSAELLLESIARLVQCSIE